ncbi:hypothetical protein GCM10028783_40580 [Modestobacter muralis]
MLLHESAVHDLIDTHEGRDLRVLRPIVFREGCCGRAFHHRLEGHEPHEGTGPRARSGSSRWPVGSAGERRGAAD